MNKHINSYIRQTFLAFAVTLMTVLQVTDEPLFAQSPPSASPVLPPEQNSAPADTYNTGATTPATTSPTTTSATTTPTITSSATTPTNTPITTPATTPANNPIGPYSPGYTTGACSNALPFPGPTFDPYSTSNSSYNYSPYSPNTCQTYNYNTNPTQCDTKATNSQKLLDSWNADIMWFSGGSDGQKLGLTQIQLDATLAFPLCFDPKNSLKITPGVNFNFWNPDCGFIYDDPANKTYYYYNVMPDRTYDLYGDFAWTPQLNDWISVDLAVRLGVYSDFHTVKGEALRITGHAIGKFKVSQAWEAQLGIDYINRVNTKLLPVVGVVWTSPDKTRRFDCVFPYPKYSQKCTLVDSKTELWWYVRGEYGGGTWNVYTGLPYDEYDNVSYNDVRIAVGIDFEFAGNVHGYFELGGAFNRKVEYQHGPERSLGDSFFLGGGLYF